MDHDLLEQPLISWRDGRRRRATASLPEVLALLATGELCEFAAVRPHQFHPWCMFLIQLAAIALNQARESSPRIPASEWRRLLLSLTGGSHEPWSLVVDDLSKPAFFQPPVPEGSIEGWSRCSFPDDVDILVTAKAHDVKTNLINPPNIEAWVYSLVTLQTTQGYPGRGYNRISRMKGGYGNRPRVGLTRDQSLTARFLRDIDVVLGGWEEQIERGYSRVGLALTWLSQWDGKSSLSMSALRPHFIEICWRIRCVGRASAVSCCYSTTQARRCLPEEESGDVGDPWIPVAKVDRGALTVGKNGFHYKLMADLLAGENYEDAAAQKPLPSDGDPVLFVASALARGQGKTEGLHERTIVLSGKTRRRLAEADGRALLGRRATVQVTLASTMRQKVLYPALKQLAGGGETYPDTFDAAVDEMYFDRLFASLEMTDENAKLDFARRLREIAWCQLQLAIDRTNTADAQRYKAISGAEAMFSGCLRKNFGDLVAAGGPIQGVDK